MTSLLRWGILGTASICEKVIPAIRSSGSGSVQAVASRTRQRAQEFARRHGIPEAFASYQELVDSDRIDLVYVPLPNSLHAEWTIRCLDAGKHVLTEKPLALNAAEARAVAAAAARTGKHVAEAYMYRFHPVWDKAAALVGSGAIGRVTSLDSAFCFLLDEPGSIVADPDLGGGALMDVGCYCVSFSRLMAGAEPTAVRAVARFADPSRRVDLALSGVLGFPGGVLARFHTAIDSAERHRAEIHGTTGTLVLESPWHPGDVSASIRIERHAAAAEVVTVPGADPYALEVEDFVAAAQGRRTPRWPIQDAVRNMEVIDALRNAAAAL